MRKLLTLIAATFLVVSIATAAPCNTGASVLTLGTCDFGGLTFSNWDVQVAGFTSATVFFGTGSQVVGNSVNVQFKLTSDPALAPVGGGDILLSYLVTGGLTGVDISLGSRFGGVNIIENACPDQGCSTTLAQLYVANGGPTSAAATFPSTSQVWIYKDIRFLEGGALSDFVNSHEIPEPMTYLLLGSGLLGLGLLRRRMNKS